MAVGVYVGTTENEESMEGLFDADFTQNMEYFRSDTLSLGYKNEAQRVLAENKLADGSYDIDAILQIAFGDRSYYVETDVKQVEIGNVTVIAVAYRA